MVLEVDGSLANPYAAGAVAVWTAILSAISIALVRGRSASGWSIAKPFVFGALLLATRPLQILIGNVLYKITDPGITSVGFWGGPPTWIAPTVSCCLGLLAWVYLRHRRP
jgi:hypothetical protein